MAYTVNSLLDSLANADTFDLSELEINRQGWISPRQKSRHTRYAVFKMVSAFLILALLIGIYFFGPRHWKGEAVIGAIALLTAACILVCQGAVIFADVSQGRAAVVEGAVTSARSFGRNSSSYYYVVNRKKYSGASYDGRALIDNNPGNYRLYHLPRTRRMLSIEPVSIHGTAPR